jgi:pimeloyl-ACP methyl ester carboxylesterase
VSDLPPDEFVPAMVPSMFSPSVTDEVVATFANSVRTFRPGGFRAMARASVEDQSHVLPEVDVPTLLLYSDYDVRAPVAVGEAMHAMVPGSQLVVLRGPGHVSSMEAPNDVTHELRRFLSSVTCRPLERLTPPPHERDEAHETPGRVIPRQRAMNDAA